MENYNIRSKSINENIFMIFSQTCHTASDPLAAAHTRHWCRVLKFGPGQCGMFTGQLLLLLTLTIGWGTWTTSFCGSGGTSILFTKIYYSV
ncbi:hypothetical protein Indivirus_5_9 [Indivirus ILV1]|uniref:Uncharacterized protein n=1 Tax=Indivirus ILV1 TaxID=1977633 RepID=A0A1V0SDU5_9VIRU|nr:hypothetical protein Indivirus_5_9 [Indivirus ILV1]